MTAYRNFVGNEYLSDNSRESLNTFNPVDESFVASCVLASKDDVEHAVATAYKSQKTWGCLPSVERAQHMRRWGAKILENAKQIGNILSSESGKSCGDGESEVTYGVDILNYHAEWARRIEGDILPSDNPDETLYLHRIPIGVVVCLIPFNFPVYVFLRKVAPALIAGNTVIVRPSNHTPCSAFELAKCAVEAGLPPGVLNVLTMDHDVCKTLCSHKHVGMSSLTGSLEAGRKVLEYSQKNISKASLELGGKTPALVFPDADLAKAAKQIASSATANAGQLCTSVERVYVIERVYETFVELLKREFYEISTGDRNQDPNLMGPLINEASRQRIHAMVEMAKAQGATLEIGGTLPQGKGYFYPATLFSNCRHEMDLIQEEVFGPVLAIVPVKDEDEAIEKANDHEFALASVVYTETYRTVMNVSHRIEAGELYVNRTPADPYQGFHAGHKRSGLGGDDGKHGMLAFTQTKLVVMPH